MLGVVPLWGCRFVSHADVQPCYRQQTHSVPCYKQTADPQCPVSGWLSLDSAIYIRAVSITQWDSFSQLDVKSVEHFDTKYPL